MTKRLDLPWLRPLAALGTAATAALALAACGGSSDTATATKAAASIVLRTTAPFPIAHPHA